MTLLHSFGSAGDGSAPHGGLVNVNGTLYGMTALGGSKNFGTVLRIAHCSERKSLRHDFAGGAHHGGTVFELTPSGVETVLHSFGSGNDGAVPYAGLLDVAGTLYGTTLVGGAKDVGTVFALQP